MRSPRKLPYDDAMRCIRLFDLLDKFALTKFDIDHDPNAIDYQLRAAARQLWQKDRKFIPAFLAANVHLSPEDIDCISKWRRNIKGQFILLKYNRGHAVFYSRKNSTYYAVKALTNDFKEVFPIRAPLLLETALFAYNDQIIWDGIASVTNNITFGKNLARSFAKEADEAKENGKLIMQL